MKLVLHRETLRTLTNTELYGVAGGRPPHNQPIPRPTEGIEETCQGYTHMPCPGSVTCTTVTLTCGSALNCDPTGCAC